MVRERNVLAYQTRSGVFPYREWRNGFNDEDTEVALDVRVTRFSTGNFGDSRPIGDGASESSMEKPAVSYKEELLGKLKNPRYCAKYLSASICDSTETFLIALRNVVEAQKGMARVATGAGVNRENLYRMLSEDGNPRLSSLDAVLRTLGLRLVVVTDPSAPPAMETANAGPARRRVTADARR